MMELKVVKIWKSFAKGSILKQAFWNPVRTESERRKQSAKLKKVILIAIYFDKHVKLFKQHFLKYKYLRKRSSKSI